MQKCGSQNKLTLFTHYCQAPSGYQKQAPNSDKQIPKLHLIFEFHEGLTEMFKGKRKGTISKEAIKVKKKLNFEVVSIVFD